jgi:hypothetical protein
MHFKGAITLGSAPSLARIYEFGGEFIGYFYQVKFDKAGTTYFDSQAALKPLFFGDNIVECAGVSTTAHTYGLCPNRILTAAPIPILFPATTCPTHKLDVECFATLNQEIWDFEDYSSALAGHTIKEIYQTGVPVPVHEFGEKNNVIDDYDPIKIPFQGLLFDGWQFTR